MRQYGRRFELPVLVKVFHIESEEYLCFGSGSDVRSFKGGGRQKLFIGHSLVVTTNNYNNFKITVIIIRK
jgi:hypothetical protein